MRGLIKSLLKFFLIAFLALCVTWIMLTRTVGTRIVPSLIGLAERDAVRLLESEDLEPAAERNYRKSDPPGTVYGQSPAANSKVREGRRVRVFVSRGPAKSVMPDLRGLTLMEAKNRLRTIGEEQNVHGGLTLEAISHTSHVTVPADHVISFFPPAGHEVIIGDKVQVLISTGPPQTTVVVPNVIGMERVEAEAALESAQLLVRRVSKELTSSEPGRILRTSPPPGTPVSGGEGIDLVVSVPRNPRVSNQPRMVLIRYVVPLLMESMPFNLVLTDQEGSRNVYTGTPAPGKVLEFAERVIGEAELKIYVDGILSKTIPYKPR